MTKDEDKMTNNVTVYHPSQTREEPHNIINISDHRQVHYHEHHDDYYINNYDDSNNPAYGGGGLLGGLVLSCIMLFCIFAMLGFCAG